MYTAEIAVCSSKARASAIAAARGSAHCGNAAARARLPNGPDASKRLRQAPMSWSARAHSGCSGPKRRRRVYHSSSEHCRSSSSAPMTPASHSLDPASGWPLVLGAALIFLPLRPSSKLLTEDGTAASPASFPRGGASALPSLCRLSERRARSSAAAVRRSVATTRWRLPQTSHAAPSAAFTACDMCSSDAADAADSIAQRSVASASSSIAAATSIPAELNALSASQPSAPPSPFRSPPIAAVLAC
eukprot:3454187-Pleurochrysis_carterae.AAC.3